MPTIRKARERGHADHGWLDTWHTFSFADYHDPAHMGYSLLRVINEDRVAPGMGFGAHPHRDMEIVTYVLEGALAHRDSMGHEQTLGAGEVQRMSAGTGVVHSEYNASPMTPVHFLQIWLLPGGRGIAPSYEQRAFPAEARRGRLAPVVTPDGREGSLRIHTDASLYLAALAPGDEASSVPPAGRRAYVHVARGTVRLNGQLLEAGDGARVEPGEALRLTTDAGGEALVFDLP